MLKLLFFFLMGKTTISTVSGKHSDSVCHKGNSVLRTSGGLKFSGRAFLQHSDLPGSWYDCHPKDEGEFQYLAGIWILIWSLFFSSTDRNNFPVLQCHETRKCRWSIPVLCQDCFPCNSGTLAKRHKKFNTDLLPFSIKPCIFIQQV